MTVISVDLSTGKQIERPYTEEELAANEAAKKADTPTPEQSIKIQISQIEARITSRRLREAILGDDGWLQEQEDKISKLREQI